MEPKFTNETSNLPNISEDVVEKQEIGEDNIAENIHTEKKDVTVKTEEVKGLLKKMKDKIVNISNFTGISERDVIEMAGLEYDIMEELNNPEASLAKVNGVVEYLHESNDDDIKLYMENFDVAMSSINPRENPSKILEYASKHHIAMTLGFIALYLSTTPSAFAEGMFDQDIKIDYNGETLSFEDLVKNPEFKEAIDANLDIPIDVLQAYSTNPLSNEDGLAMNFAISHTQDGTEVIGVNMMGSYDVQGDVQERQEDFVKINDLLLSVTEGHNWSNNAVENKMTMEEFENNKEMLINEISSIMNIPEKEVSNHFEKIFEAVENSEEKTSVVPLENFNIDENFEPKGEVQEKYDEIVDKYNTDIPEEKAKAIEEFKLWGEENGHENVWNALSQEKLDNPFSRLESHEGKGVMDEEIYGKFIVNELEERGYEMKELQNDHEKAIEAIFDYIVERQGIEDNEEKKDALRIGLESWENLENGKNIDNLLSGEEVDFLPHLIRTFESDVNNEHENFREELIKDTLEKYGIDIEKLNEISKENPREAIAIIANMVEKEFNENQGFDGKDQSALFMGIKDTLEKMGIENLDKFVVTQTTTEDSKIVSQLIAPTENGKFRTTSIDFSSIGDEPLKQEDIPEKIEKVHNSVLEKIKELNIRERIEKIIRK